MIHVTKILISEMINFLYKFSQLISEKAIVYVNQRPRSLSFLPLLTPLVGPGSKIIHCTHSLFLSFECYPLFGIASQNILFYKRGKIKLRTSKNMDTNSVIALH